MTRTVDGALRLPRQMVGRSGCAPETSGSPGSSSSDRAFSRSAHCRSTPMPWAFDSVRSRSSPAPCSSPGRRSCSTAKPLMPSPGGLAHAAAPSGCGPRTNLAWLACAVQLAGTLWFNWSTANALRVNLAAAEADQRVWRPDALGSIAFLVASLLALRDAESGSCCRPTQAPGLADQCDQSGRLGGVRRLGRCGLCHSVERRRVERRVVQSRHADRSRLLSLSGQSSCCPGTGGQGSDRGVAGVSGPNRSRPVDALTGGRRPSRPAWRRPPRCPERACRRARGSASP